MMTYVIRFQYKGSVLATVRSGTTAQEAVDSFMEEKIPDRFILSVFPIPRSEKEAELEYRVREVTRWEVVA